MPTVLTAAQTRFLRGQAHDLKAMLQIGGKGLTDAVVAEVELALEHHELIKIKVAAADREARDAMMADLAQRAGAALVQRIGQVLFNNDAAAGAVQQHRLGLHRPQP